jgi:hypothetical protein
MSPTTLTLKFFRDQGWLADVTERWIAQAGIRKDLFGIIDLIAIKAGEAVIGLQATSLSNVPARVAKAKASGPLAIWLKTGARFQVIGWTRRGKKWSPKIVELLADQIEPVVVEKPRRKRPQRFKQGDLFERIP